MRLHPSSYARPAGIAMLACAFLFTGCSASFAPVSTTSASLAGLQGQLHGGRQPVAGAHVYLFAASTSGYGSASTSLLQPVSTGPFPTTKDVSDNNYYLTTDSGGNFLLTEEYACTANSQVYLYAVGGNPGLPEGQTNSAAGFLAILGNCPADGTFAVHIPSIIVNEVSTVAAAYAFAGFAVDATHVGSSGTPLALTGIANAFANAVNLYDVTGNGGGLARTAPAFSAGVVPQREIHALANSLAACVNSTGPSSTQCAALFDNVKSNGATGATATDTATVAINIAHNPANAISTILNNALEIGTPFVPTLSTPPASATPTDLTLEMNIYSGSLSFPTYLAIDADGNVWVNSYSSSLTKYSPLGALLSGQNGYSGGGLVHGNYIAIDTLGNAWVANQTGGTVSEFSPSGVPANSSGFAGNNDLDPAGIAFDAAGEAVITNASKNTISRLDSTGAEVGGPYNVPGLSMPWGVAIDANANVWVANYNANQVVESSLTGVQIGTSPFGTTGGTPRAVAIGANGSAWVANYTDTNLTHFTSAGVGTAVSGGGLSAPADIAVDGDGNAWAPNHGGNSVSEFSSAGVALSPANGFRSPDINIPYGIAVDGSGNVWITNSSGDTLSEFVGAAAPTITPTVAAVIAKTIATRP